MRFIPNLLTLTNLFLGCIALVDLLGSSEPKIFIWCIFGSLLADFFDGAAARLLKVDGALGTQLDSLADMISFGVVPGAILYRILLMSEGIQVPGLFLEGIFAFVLTAFSGLRLARFNLDTRQTVGFIGLATPACTMLVLGFWFWVRNGVTPFSEWMNIPWVIYGIVLVLSYLLNAELPMFSGKISSFSWKGNEIRIVFLVLCLALYIIFRENALAAMMILYLVLSFITYLIQGRKA
jgi:CDP-diacylglycerol---serine O-phosphatidyltransferase